MADGWRIRHADFDRAVHRILAQPFLLKAKVDLWLGELRTDLSTPLSERHELERSA
jgi:hypothetical protein